MKMKMLYFFYNITLFFLDSSQEPLYLSNFTSEHKSLSKLALSLFVGESWTLLFGHSFVKIDSQIHASFISSEGMIVSPN